MGLPRRFPKPLNPSLRHALQIQYQAGGTRTSSGAVVEDWQPGVSDTNSQTNVRAAIEDQSGREASQGKQQVALGSVLITIRFVAGLTSAHRFFEPLTNRIWQIASVNRKDDLPQWLLCDCVERTPKA